MKRTHFEKDTDPGLAGRTLTPLQHSGVYSPQSIDNRIARGSFLKLLLTVLLRREASASEASHPSKMGVRSDLIAGRYITVCTSEQAAEGGQDELVFRLASVD
jgi:hypothetical protein